MSGIKAHKGNELRTPIGPDAPLRLDVAAAIGFPDGSMTAKGLRREAARGRLAVSRVAGKDYTTIAAIGRMIEQCRVPGMAPGSGCDRRGATVAAESATPPHGSSATAGTSKAHDAARTIATALRERSPATLSASMSTARRKGNVIRLKSRSPTL